MTSNVLHVNANLASAIILLEVFIKMSWWQELLKAVEHEQDCEHDFKNDKEEISQKQDYCKTG